MARGVYWTAKHVMGKYYYPARGSNFSSMSWSQIGKQTVLI